MQVRMLDAGKRRDVQQFVNFPFQLYQDCVQWVPPLVSAAKNVLNRRRHPFYQHSTADFFVAESEGQALGRIAVMHNHRYNEYRQVEAALFGYFDVVEDVEVARALFAAAFEWARGRGLNEMLGPRGLVSSEVGGVLVEGFEHRAALGIPYNFPYYGGFIEAVGFEKAADFLSGHFQRGHQVPERLWRVAEKVKARGGFWIKTFRSKREMRQWIPRVGKIYREAFVEAHTYYPLSDAEMEVMAETIISVADPRLIKLVMKGEEVVGFLLTYHDISAGLQKARGRLWPLGWYYILRERKRTRWANGNGVGVLPEYQGVGASILLYAEIAQTMIASDFEHLDVAQVNEENLASRSAMEDVGVQWYKRHRSYRRMLASTNWHGWESAV
jgi:L-amino acid N-acyltransferase YncA